MTIHFRSAALFCLMVSASTVAQQRNVLVLVADDLGVDGVGAYGEATAPPPTPNIDALAASGVLFRNAWAAPVCSATRACIQTGRHGFRTGVGHVIPVSSSPGLPFEEQTIPERLDASGSGYAHACIGKWHLTTAATGGNQAPGLHGYGHFAGVLGGSVSSYYNWPRNVNGSTSTSTTYITTQQVDDALAWTGTATRPWFCIVNFVAPHTPFHAPPANLHSQNLTGLNPSATPLPFYKAMVEAMDNEIGRLLASLGTTLANTDVIFIGDNGTDQQVSEAPFPSNHAKGTTFEGGINVPLIVSGPSVVAGGREVTSLVAAVDLFSTVLELAGARPADYIAIDGVSLVPYLTDPSQGPLRTHVYSELFSDSSPPPPSATARDDQYKLIQRLSFNTIERFYDLDVDPFESNNLLGAPGGLTTTQSQRLQSLRDVIDDLLHPQASVTPYGAATCNVTGVPMTISATGSPTLGATVQFGLANAPPAAVAHLFLGTSDESWLGLTLPSDLAPFGAPAGCQIWASGETWVSGVTSGAGDLTLPLTVPNLPLALGAEVYHQWVVEIPGAIGFPYVTTAGLHLRVGE